MSISLAHCSCSLPQELYLRGRGRLWKTGGNPGIGRKPNFNGKPQSFGLTACATGAADLPIREWLTAKTCPLEPMTSN
jgi:hypothetical protein